MCIPSLCLRLSVFVFLAKFTSLHDRFLTLWNSDFSQFYLSNSLYHFVLPAVSVWILFMLFLMSFNNVGSPSITNSDEGQNCLSFMLVIALHWVTSWSAQIPRLRIFMPLAGSRGLRQFANKAGSSSTICPLYGWYQTMKFNLTMVTARELSICKKKLVPGNTGWQNLCCKRRYLQMNGRRISACRQKDQQWHHQQQTVQPGSSDLLIVQWCKYHQNLTFYLVHSFP